jgi:hypothetical protein
VHPVCGRRLCRRVEDQSTRLTKPPGARQPMHRCHACIGAATGRESREATHERRLDARRLGSAVRILPRPRLRSCWMPKFFVRLILGAALGAIVAGCNVSGVTRDPSHVRLTNDLHRAVRLRLCATNDCRHGFDPPDETLAPGQSWPVNVSSIGVPNVYLVEQPNGQRIGCLPLVSPSLRRSEIVVRVSEHVACRGGLDEHVFWPPRWKRAN